MTPSEVGRSGICVGAFGPDRRRLIVGQGGAPPY